MPGTHRTPRDARQFGTGVGGTTQESTGCVRFSSVSACDNPGSGPSPSGASIAAPPREPHTDHCSGTVEPSKQHGCDRRERHGPGSVRLHPTNSVDAVAFGMDLGDQVGQHRAPGSRAQVAAGGGAHRTRPQIPRGSGRRSERGDRSGRSSRPPRTSFWGSPPRQRRDRLSSTPPPAPRQLGLEVEDPLPRRRELGVLSGGEAGCSPRSMQSWRRPL